MKTSFTRVMLLIAFITFSCHLQAQKKSEDKKKDSVKTVTETTKSSKKVEGLFTLYQDTITGSTRFYVMKNQLGKEFIYQSFSMGGPPELFLNQNMLRNTWVFKIEKNFNRISWTKVNTSFYYDPENPISKSANADASEANFYTTKIIAEDKEGYLIDADELLLSERLDPIRPFIQPKTPPESYLNLGKLQSSNSTYLRLRSYPKNTDILVNLSYQNEQPINFGGKDITDARYINVKMQHSFIEMPDNDYQPRLDDPRVGYFLEQNDDMTNIIGPNYRDYIHRWHLKKKDPGAEISDPVEPIVWWIENTTPLEYRNIIIEAGLKWNEAFKHAGFSNAVEMKIMPDDAGWEPEDIRYNVIRWVSSNLGYAIGPSFVNPRTGQILGADITIDYGIMTAATYVKDIFGDITFDDSYDGSKNCSIGKGLKTQFQSGLTLLEGAGNTLTDKKKLTDQFLTMLILHEMGHTLGLNHNMKSSYMLSPAELKDQSITRKYGVTGSVMDYPSANVSLNSKEQGDYYTVKTGPYDWWAIQFGYTPFKPEEEQMGLKNILSKSTDPKLIFGNDADIAAPGRGIDPRVQIWDMSNDMINYAKERFELVNKTIPILKDRIVEPDKSYQNLIFKYNSLWGQRFTMSRALATYIGGIEIDRSYPGQKSGTMPLVPVSAEKQRNAMMLLNKYLFAPDAFEADKVIYPYLQQQRRDFEFMGKTEDPKLNYFPDRIQNVVLTFILHPVTLERMANSGLYGNSYTAGMVVDDLIDHCFEADLRSDVNIFRQNLQINLVNKLCGIVKDEKSEYPSSAKASAYNGLLAVKSRLVKNNSGNSDTKAHRKYLVYQIDETLDKD